MGQLGKALGRTLLLYFVFATCPGVHESASEDTEDLQRRKSLTLADSLHSGFDFSCLPGGGAGAALATTARSNRAVHERHMAPGSYLNGVSIPAPACKGWGGVGSAEVGWGPYEKCTTGIS
jgi:hypothetical protein